MKQRIIATLLAGLMIAPLAQAMDLKQHHTDAGLECQDCHIDANMTIPSNASCLNCHGSLEDLREAVKQPESQYYLDTNPHYSFHYGYGLECSACHSEHQESKLYCNNCHQFDYPEFK
ncbi:cytochrome c3 family protein [Ferrimonas senticii]|uniref:cytochrome c3 family protein n=1 Tax=Ferrimonas senticii TaxID=394566 RepID=UPI000403F254|nr:cytochrome c3 family protein [Ferrimonas senticii]